MPSIPGREQLSPAFLGKVEAMASRLGANPDDLLSVMAFETGGSFSPSVRNQAGSGATGLIQFLPSTAEGLGTSPAALARMTAEEQLDVVERYFTPYKGRLGSLKDTYMAVLSPNAVGADEGRVLFQRGTKAYTQNAGLDRDRKGFVTVGDATEAVQRFVTGGPGFGLSATPDEEMTREIARVRAQQRDDMSQGYLDAKNTEIDAEFQRELAQIRPLQPAQVPMEQAKPALAGITASDVVARLGEDALQVVGGARDAFVNTMQTLNLLGDWMRERGLGPSGKLTISIPEVREGDTIEGPLLRSASQFLAAFLPATKLVGALGMVGKISSGLAAGALADFAAFDPTKPRVSNLINDLAPALKNPVTTFLATSPDDSEAEGRLKNALEGLGLGLVTNGLLYAVKALREIKAMGSQLGQAAEEGWQAGGKPLTPATRQLSALSDADIRKAVDEEVTTATAKHTAQIDAVQTRLAAIMAGDGDAIEATLTTAKAVVARDGSVALGRGQDLRRFDTAQEAAQFVTERRLERLQSTDPYQPMNALKRALGGQEPQEGLPSDAVQRFAQREASPVVELVVRAEAVDMLPYQNMQLSGAADALPRTGKTAHVNFYRVNTSDDVKQVIATVAELTQAEAEAQRRGVRTVGETAAAAAESPYRELDRILGITPGTALNAEDAYAVRQVWVSAAEQLHAAARRAATGDQAAYQEALKLLVLTSNIHTTATGVRGEAGRALQIFGVQMPSTDRRFLAEIGDVLTNATGLDPQTIMTRIAALPSKEQLAKFLVDSSTITRADMFTELWYGALLSNPATHVVNTLDSALRTTWAIPERYVSVALSGANGVSMGEANAALYGLRQGLGEAWQYAAKAFRTGESAFDAVSKVEAAPRMAMTGANAAKNFPRINAALGLDEGILGGFVELLGAAVRIPGRLLMAADELFKVVNYRSELHAQAYRRAMQEGLEGPALARRIVALTEEPLPALKDKAIAFANYQTLAQPLNQEGAAFEALGRVAQHVVDAREDWLPLKIILPFVRTPFNVARSAAERTPLGLLSSNVRRALMEGGADGALARSKMALGSLMLGLFGWMAMEGTITGKAPSDPGLRDTWQRLGIQEYSLKIGNTYYSYNRFDLFGLPLGLMADFVTIAREAPVQRLETVAGAVLAGIFQNLTSKTYLKGVADVIEAMTPGQGETATQQGQQFERYLARLAGSVVPAGVAAVARMLDPVQRETRTMLDTMLARLPGNDLPARMDLWGRPRLNAEPIGPDLLSPVMSREYQPDAVDEELLRQQVPLRMPDRVVRIAVPGMRESEPIELTPQQYQRYVQLSADVRADGSSGLKDALSTLMESRAYREQLSDGPNGGKSLVIRNLVATYRETARAKLREEDKSVNALLIEQRLVPMLGQTKGGEGQTPAALNQLGIERRSTPRAPDAGTETPSLERLRIGNN